MLEASLPLPLTTAGGLPDITFRITGILLGAILVVGGTYLYRIGITVFGFIAGGAVALSVAFPIVANGLADQGIPSLVGDIVAALVVVLIGAFIGVRLAWEVVILMVSGPPFITAFVLTTQRLGLTPVDIPSVLSAAFGIFIFLLVFGYPILGLILLGTVYAQWIATTGGYTSLADSIATHRNNLFGDLAEGILDPSFEQLTIGTHLKMIVFFPALVIPHAVVTWMLVVPEPLVAMTLAPNYPLDALQLFIDEVVRTLSQLPVLSGEPSPKWIVPFVAGAVAGGLAWIAHEYMIAVGTAVVGATLLSVGVFAPAGMTALADGRYGDLLTSLGELTLLLAILTIVGILIQWAVLSVEYLPAWISNAKPRFRP